MPLFRGHPLRTLVIAGLVMWSSHRIIKHLPPSLHLFTFTQTSIAVASLAALMLVVITHRRRQGQILSQTQEELLLVAAFGLFWFSAFIAYRAYGQNGNTGLPNFGFGARRSPGVGMHGGTGAGPHTGAGFAQPPHPPSPPSPPPNVPTLQPSPITYRYNEYARPVDPGPPFGIGNPPPGPRYTVRGAQPQGTGGVDVAAPAPAGGAEARVAWPCAGDAVAAPGKRRIETDVMKMLMSDYDVELVNDNMQEFYVRFQGPDETPFAGGFWKIHVELPDQYPFKSPSIGFMNKIFHPNIDELSGSVCLDVINQTWSPMFDLINIFEVFLPQLLRYPNPSDPLNGEAAALLMRHPKDYDAKVKDYVTRFATREIAFGTEGKAAEEEKEDEEMSDIGSFSDADDE